MVINVDSKRYGQTNVWTDGKPNPYIVPCLRQAWQNEDKQSRHSFLQHSLLTCSMIQPSTIKIIFRVAELCSGNKMLTPAHPPPTVLCKKFLTAVLLCTLFWLLNQAAVRLLPYIGMPWLETMLRCPLSGCVEYTGQFSIWNTYIPYFSGYKTGFFGPLKWLQITKSVLWNFAIIPILPFLDNPKDLDPSYKIRLTRRI